MACSDPSQVAAHCCDRGYTVTHCYGSGEFTKKQADTIQPICKSTHKYTTAMQHHARIQGVHHYASFVCYVFRVHTIGRFVNIYCNIVTKTCRFHSSHYRSFGSSNPRMHFHVFPLIFLPKLWGLSFLPKLRGLIFSYQSSGV